MVSISSFTVLASNMADQMLPIKPAVFRSKYGECLKTMKNWPMLEKELDKYHPLQRKLILTKTFCMKELHQALHLACKLGLLSAFKYLLEKCLLKIGDEYTKGVYLITAVGLGNSNVAKYVVEKLSANVNFKDDSGVSVLHTACAKGDIAMVEYLLKHGANMKIKDNIKSTCLMAGAYCGSLKICKLAIERGVDVNARTEAGQTAIHSAIMERAPLEVVQLLMDSGADPNCINAQKIPVVAYAAIKIKDIHPESTKILGYLLKHPKVTMENKILAMKYAFALLKGMGNEPRGFKFLTRAIQMQEKYGNGNENNNSIISTEYDIVNKEPSSEEEVKEMKNNMEKKNSYMLGLFFRMHLLYGYNNLRFIGLLLEDLVTPCCFDLFLQAFAFIFHHTFCGDENITDLPNNFYSEFVFKVIRRSVEKDKKKFSPVLFDFLRKIVSAFNHTNRDCVRIPPALHHMRQKKVNIMAHVEFQVPEFLNKIPFQADDSSRHKFRFMRFVVELFCLVLELYPEKKTEISMLICRLVNTHFRDEKGSTFLHISMQNIDMPWYDADLTIESQLDIVKLLLQEGAPVNAMDSYLFTPSHYLANMSYVDGAQGVADKLIEHGAHLDYRSMTGDSPVDEIDYAEITVNKLANQTLQCLAAHAINVHNIPYKDSVPKSLLSFIERHDPDERVDIDSVPDFFHEMDRGEYDDSLDDVPEHHDSSEGSDDDIMEPDPYKVEFVKRALERLVGQKIYD